MTEPRARDIAVYELNVGGMTQVEAEALMDRVEQDGALEVDRLTQAIESVAEEDSAHDWHTRFEQARDIAAAYAAVTPSKKVARR